MLKEHNPNLSETQETFLEYDREVRIKKLKICCMLIVLLMPAGFSLDYFVYPEKFWYFLKLRLFCSLLAGIVWGILTIPSARNHLKILEMVVISLPAIFISWMIYETEGSSSPYYAGLNLVLVGAGVIMFWTFQENILFQGLVMMMYLGACFFYGHIQDISIFYNNLYFIALTMILVTTGSYFQRNLFYREFIHRFELDKHRKLLEESNRKLVDLDQMKSRFFANISHELRTPVTLVLAPLETLLNNKEPLPIEVQKLLQMVHGNGLRLLKLINDLLDLVKLESGKMEVNRNPLRVDTLINIMAESVDNLAQENGIRLETVVQEDMEPILADQDKLEKIMLNLVMNAIKFTPPGGQVEVWAGMEGDTLSLTVKDTGIGISEKNLDHIFDRFWQGDPASRREYQGTGLGLALVKELAELQGGSVSAKSQPGIGTTFTIRIPTSSIESYHTAASGRRETPTNDLPQNQLEIFDKKESDEWLARLSHRPKFLPASHSLVESSPASKAESRDNGARVLIADDEPFIREFLRIELAQDFQVLEARDGHEVIEKVMQFLPDLILLDIMMPGKDGLQICRELRENPLTQSIPIIILTGQVDEQAKLNALSVGASDFLGKPFSTTELRVRIQNLIQSYRLQKDLNDQKVALEITLEQLKDTEVQLVQTEKMASLGRWSAGVIHEVNNPLNFCLSATYMLKKKAELLPEEARAGFNETLCDIEEGMHRIKDIATNLKAFVHPDPSRFDSLELKETVETALKFLKEQWSNTVRIELRIPEGQQVWGNKGALLQVFMNMIQNSLDALRKKSFDTEHPTIWIQSHLAGDRIQLTIRDNGEGIVSDNLHRIFDPFFTTRDVGEGIGLGLGICYRILQDHGGSITASSEPGKFCEFLLQMPVK